MVTGNNPPIDQTFGVNVTYVTDGIRSGYVKGEDFMSGLEVPHQMTFDALKMYDYIRKTIELRFMRKRSKNAENREVTVEGFKVDNISVRSQTLEFTLESSSPNYQDAPFIVNGQVMYITIAFKPCGTGIRIPAQLIVYGKSYYREDNNPYILQDKPKWRNKVHSFKIALYGNVVTEPIQYLPDDLGNGTGFKPGFGRELLLEFRNTDSANRQGIIFAQAWFILSYLNLLQPKKVQDGMKNLSSDWPSAVRTVGNLYGELANAMSVLGSQIDASNSYWGKPHYYSEFPAWRSIGFNDQTDVEIAFLMRANALSEVDINHLQYIIDLVGESLEAFKTAVNIGTNSAFQSNNAQNADWISSYSPCFQTLLQLILGRIVTNDIVGQYSVDEVSNNPVFLVKAIGSLRFDHDQNLDVVLNDIRQRLLIPYGLITAVERVQQIQQYQLHVPEVKAAANDYAGNVNMVQLLTPEQLATGPGLYNDLIMYFNMAGISIDGRTYPDPNMKSVFSNNVTTRDGANVNIAQFYSVVPTPSIMKQVAAGTSAPFSNMQSNVPGAVPGTSQGVGSVASLNGFVPGTSMLINPTTNLSFYGNNSIAQDTTVRNGIGHDFMTSFNNSINQPWQDNPVLHRIGYRSAVHPLSVNTFQIAHDPSTSALMLYKTYWEQRDRDWETKTDAKLIEMRDKRAQVKTTAQNEQLRIMNERRKRKFKEASNHKFRPLQPYRVPFQTTVENEYHNEEEIERLGNAFIDDAGS